MNALTVTIQAPELSQALLSLATAITTQSQASPTLPAGLTPAAQTTTAPPAPTGPPASPSNFAPPPVAPPQYPAAQMQTAPVQTAMPPAAQYPPSAQYPPTQYQPQTAPPATGMPPAAPAPTYTLDQLSVAATPLLDNGRQHELTALLQSFGVVSLTTLPPEQYGAFALALRSMGAQI